MLQLLSLTKSDFSSKFQIIDENIASQAVEKKGYGFGQQMNSSIIHDNILPHLYINISLE